MLAVTDIITVALISMIGLLGSSIVTAYFAYRAKTVATETHQLVNSRMTEFMKMAEARFKALGKLEEKAEAKERKIAGETEKL